MRTYAIDGRRLRAWAEAIKRHGCIEPHKPDGIVADIIDYALHGLGKLLVAHVVRVGADAVLDRVKQHRERPKDYPAILCLAEHDLGYTHVVGEREVFVPDRLVLFKEHVRQLELGSHETIRVKRLLQGTAHVRKTGTIRVPGIRIDVRLVSSLDLDDRVGLVSAGLLRLEVERLGTIGPLAHSVGKKARYGSMPARGPVANPVVIGNCGNDLSIERADGIAIDGHDPILVD